MNWLVSAVLNWVWNKILSLIVAAKNKLQRQDEIQKEAEKSIEPLEKAETADEIDKGADGALDGF
jgi:hypothetical protein